MNYDAPNSYQEYHVEEHQLVLYVIKGCPYCDKVLKYLTSVDVKVLTKDIRQDKEALKDLLEIGGKKQVPCLSIDGKALYESDDIILWFKKNL